MAQSWDLPILTGDSMTAAVQTRIAACLESLRTLHSGAAAPSNPVAYMLWQDTTANALKQRNSANTAWVAWDVADQAAAIAAATSDITDLQEAFDIHAADTDPHAAAEYVKADGTRAMTDWLLGAKVGGGTEPLIRSRGFGYNQTIYPGVQVGAAGDHVALGIDPASIAGGTFRGDVLEIALPNAAYFVQANSGGTDWIGASTLVPPFCLVNGKAGFGTSTPAEAVDVAGNIKASGYVMSPAGVYIDNAYGFVNLVLPAYAGYYPYISTIPGARLAFPYDLFVTGSTDTIGSRVRDLLRCHMDVAGAGSDYVSVLPVMFLNNGADVTGTILMNGLTASQVVFTDASKILVSKAPPTVTGATVEAALTSLLSGFATMGLLVDSHTY